ncbi:MAG: cupin domain-containing protein [Sulfuriflexus sp.]|nr:cupin domain-containing protein [Sulfuriflexus sp.]
MPITLTFPNGISHDEFLRDYWQKKPLHIPAALNNFQDPLEPEELAGLACEDEIAARIIFDNGNNDWQVRQNPFTEEDFTSLPATHWTVLVQDLNKHISELDLLLEAFSFLPAWRIDDVMVSYAAPQGGVGPHTDQYDVFLLQGMGTRRWQLSSAKDDEELIAGIDLKILNNFNAEQEFLLQPGDMLYLPPGVQHYGVSDEPCMTYSVGLRAPTQLELLGDYIDQRTLTQNDDSERRYRDPAITTNSNSGEITADAIKNIAELIKNIPSNDADIKQWFGQFITSTLHSLDTIPIKPETNSDELLQHIKQGDILHRNAASRFAYIENTDSADIYIDSSTINLAGANASIAKHICNHRQFTENDLSDWLANPQCLALLTAWYEIGLLEFANNEDNDD